LLTAISVKKRFGERRGISNIQKAVTLFAPNPAKHYGETKSILAPIMLFGLMARVGIERS